MRSLYLFLIFSQSLFAEEFTAMKCQEIETKDPPFYVSDEWRQGDKIWENLRDIKDSYKVTNYIPRGSIVYSPPELYEGSNEPDTRVPIKVLNVPSKEWEDNILNSKNRGKTSLRNMATGTKNLNRAKQGTEGWIDKRSLRSAGNYVFFLQDDAPIFKGPNNRDFNKKPFRLATNAAGDFKVNRCCNASAAIATDQCFDHYLYEMLDMNLTVVDTVYMDMPRCNMSNFLTPIGKDVVEPLVRIVDELRNENPNLTMNQLERLPANQYWRNSSTPSIVREKMVKMVIDQETGQGPHGSFHYKDDDKVQSDSYMTTYSQCAFVKVLKKFKEDCKDEGCQVQFGDSYHHDAWGVHKGHDSGECVDVRPFRQSDDIDFGLDYTNKGRYSQTKTETFINLLKKSGARTIIFNDRKIGGLSRDSGGVHDDHIHVCFGEDQSKVQDTCRNGL